MTKASFLASLGLLAATMMWGFGFVAVKDNLDVTPPVYMIALRFSAASVLLALVFIKKLYGAFSSMGRRSLLTHGFYLSIFLFLAYVFQTIGCVYTTAGKNAFLTTIYVILVPLIGWLLTRRFPGRKVLAAAFIAVVGIGLLSLTFSGPDSTAFSVNKGDVLTLMCGLFFAIHIFFIARFTQQDDPIVLTVIQLFFTAIFAWILAPFYDGPFPLAAVTTAKPLLSLLYLAVFPTSIAFILQNVCQKYTPASTAAIILSLESLFGALCSVIFLGEVMSLKMIAGAALLFGAILLTEL